MNAKMKTTVLLFCLFYSSLLYSQVTFDASALDNIAKQEQNAFRMKRIPASAENTANYDVKWYRCRWNIDPISDKKGELIFFFSIN